MLLWHMNFLGYTLKGPLYKGFEYDWLTYFILYCGINLQIFVDDGLPILLSSHFGLILKKIVVLDLNLVWNLKKKFVCFWSLFGFFWGKYLRKYLFITMQRRCWSYTITICQLLPVSGR